MSEERKICPLRLLSVAIYREGDSHCIGEKCAWFLICYNLIHLTEILARTHGKEAT